MDPIERSKAANRITLIGFFLNLSLLVLKFVAGFVGRSQAMIADAVHTLTDFATDILVFVGVAFSKKPKDADHPWGHGKYETVAAFLIALTLAGVGFLIGWDGFTRLAEAITTGVMPAQPGIIAFVAAVVSIVAKELLYRATVVVGKRINSPAVIANAWHHRSDALSSIGTAVGIGGAVLVGNWFTLLDPLAAMVVSVFIVKAGFDILRQAFGDLTDKTLPPESLKEIMDFIAAFPGCSDPHHLRCRMVGPSMAMEVHVRMDGRTTLTAAHDLSRALENALRERYGSDLLVTLHMEPRKEG